MSGHPTPAGNPQGKGLVPVLDALNALRPWQAERKTGEAILRDFCLSTLVLSVLPLSQGLGLAAVPHFP